MTNLDTSFTKAQEAQAEKENADLRCEECRRTMMHCDCSRRTGLGWLEREGSGV